MDSEFYLVNSANASIHTVQRDQISFATTVEIVIHDKDKVLLNSTTVPQG